MKLIFNILGALLLIGAGIFTALDAYKIVDVTFKQSLDIFAVLFIGSCICFMITSGMSYADAREKYLIFKSKNEKK
jgi:hypothetical protein